MLLPLVYRWQWQADKSGAGSKQTANNSLLSRSHGHECTQTLCYFSWTFVVSLREKGQLQQKQLTLYSGSRAGAGVGFG